MLETFLMNRKTEVVLGLNKNQYIVFYINFAKQNTCRLFICLKYQIL